MRFTRRSFLIRLALAAAVSLVFAAPAAADPAPASTPLQVTLTEAGSFSMSLGTFIGFSSGSVTASSGYSTSAVVVLRFDDTLSYRSSFRVELSASDFTSLKRVPYAPVGTFYKIPSKNLTISKTYSPEQAQYAADTPGVGDIQATDQSGNVIPVNSSATWISGNTLDSPRNVAKGWAGMGTILTGQGIELTLNVPPAIPATFYNAILTATITFETP